MTAVVFSIIIFLTVSANAQSDSILLTQNFQFKDGIFINFEQLRHNAPIERDQIVTDIPKWDIKFYDKLLNQHFLILLTDNGKIQVPVEKIWGYSDQGTLYIRWKDDFAKIATKGALGYFAATEKVVTYYSPYNYWYYDPYYYGTQQSRELRQFIIDFHTGDVYPFTPDALAKLLQKYDSQLYNEYIHLRPKKRKKLIFVYLRKFNQRNKVYIYQKTQ